MQVNQAAQLYRLQTLDLNIAKLRNRLKQIDDLLGNDEEIVKATAQVAAAQAAQKPLHARATELDLEVKSVAAKISETETELYSGKQSNPKALKELQEEVNALKRRETSLQETLLATMQEVEDANNAITAAESALTTANETKAGRQIDLQAEKEKVVSDIATVETKRRDHAAKIDPAAIKIYDGLKSRMKGVPVAVLGPDGCSYCHVEQTSLINQQVRMGTKIVYCESCGRILASA